MKLLLLHILVLLAVAAAQQRSLQSVDVQTTADDVQPSDVVALRRRKYGGISRLRGTARRRPDQPAAGEAEPEAEEAPVRRRGRRPPAAETEAEPAAPARGRPSSRRRLRGRGRLGGQTGEGQVSRRRILRPRVQQEETPQPPTSPAPTVPSVAPTDNVIRIPSALPAQQPTFAPQAVQLPTAASFGRPSFQPQDAVDTQSTITTTPSKSKLKVSGRAGSKFDLEAYLREQKKVPVADVGTVGLPGLSASTAPSPPPPRSPVVSFSGRSRGPVQALQPAGPVSPVQQVVPEPVSVPERQSSVSRRRGSRFNLDRFQVGGGAAASQISTSTVQVPGTPEGEEQQESRTSRRRGGRRFRARVPAVRQEQEPAAEEKVRRGRRLNLQQSEQAVGRTQIAAGPTRSKTTRRRLLVRPALSRPTTAPTDVPTVPTDNEIPTAVAALVSSDVMPSPSLERAFPPAPPRPEISPAQTAAPRLPPRPRPFPTGLLRPRPTQPPAPTSQRSYLPEPTPASQQTTSRPVSLDQQQGSCSMDAGAVRLELKYLQECQLDAECPLQLACFTVSAPCHASASDTQHPRAVCLPPMKSGATCTRDAHCVTHCGPEGVCL